jgi:hypothetical protein
MKVVASLSVWLMLTWHTSPDPKIVKGDFSPVAILELFTSQGCSSCPAADALLNKVIIANKDTKVIGLSYHVTYWNHLGWVDPYSKDEYTKRQDWYQQTLNNGVYTPQEIVNGTSDFVGGNEALSNKAIKKALATPSKLAIDLELKENSLKYALTGQYDNTILNVAIVQNEVTNYVKRGENGGRQLTHNNVVLSLVTKKIAGPAGELILELPRNASKIIVFAQDIKSRQIEGASVIEL